MKLSIQAAAIDPVTNKTQHTNKQTNQQINQQTNQQPNKQTKHQTDKSNTTRNNLSDRHVDLCPSDVGESAGA